MPPTYETASGTKYSVDEKMRLLRNGVPFMDWGEPLRYIGMADALATNATRQNANNNNTLMLEKDGQPADQQHLLYLLYGGGRIPVTQVPFEEVAAHIDGKLGLVFVGDGIQKLMQTTPIKSQSQ